MNAVAVALKLIVVTAAVNSTTLVVVVKLIDIAKVTDDMKIIADILNFLVLKNQMIGWFFYRSVNKLIILCYFYIT